MIAEQGESGENKMLNMKPAPQAQHAPPQATASILSNAVAKLS